MKLERKTNGNTTVITDGGSHNLIFIDGVCDSLELWGCSTKHPDSIFYYDSFQKAIGFEGADEYWNIFQFMIESASKLSWIPHSLKLLKFAKVYLIEELAKDRKLTIEDSIVAINLMETI